MLSRGYLKTLYIPVARRTETIYRHGHVNPKLTFHDAIYVETNPAVEVAPGKEAVAIFEYVKMRE